MANTKKRKPKYVKVKGWAWVTASGEILARSNKHSLTFPCTTLIESKYLKGDK